MADQRDLERAFEAHCTELLSLACLLDIVRPAGAPLDFHRNNAVLTAIARCLNTGDQLSAILIPHARTGSWRRTVQSYNAERRARGITGDTASESTSSKAP